MTNGPQADGYVQVSTTTETRDQANAIAGRLVEERLAACVQVIGPISSTYRWQGSVEHAEEWLCLIKTRADRLDEVETEIASIHPYEVPEVIATPVAGGSASYLSWLAAEVSVGDPELSATKDRH